MVVGQQLVSVSVRQVELVLEGLHVDPTSELSELEVFQLSLKPSDLGLEL